MRKFLLKILSSFFRILSSLYFSSKVCYTVLMSFPSYLKKLFYKLRLRRNNLSFPVRCKLRGVSARELQGALFQSEVLDELQIVHCPTPQAPFRVIAYSIPLNRVLGYLDEALSEKLVRALGEGFCRDGEIANRTGGKNGGYYGCNIRIFESMEFMSDLENFKHLHGE